MRTIRVLTKKKAAARLSVLPLGDGEGPLLLELLQRRPHLVRVSIEPAIIPAERGAWGGRDKDGDALGGGKYVLGRRENMCSNGIMRKYARLWEPKIEIQNFRP